jgi:hypothetical protein
MQADHTALRWAAVATLAVALAAPVAIIRGHKSWYVTAPLAVIGLALAFIQTPSATVATDDWRWAPIALVALMALTRFVPQAASWVRPAVLAAAAGVFILLLMRWFNASSTWYTMGFEYGTQKFEDMVTGRGSHNIPRMMMVYWHWPEQTTDPVTVPWINKVITFTDMTRYIYAVTVVLCGIGAAIHHRRRDPRFLVAMVAPWLLFFVILTQMHGRYTVWAGGLSALLAAESVGLSLLGVIVSIAGVLGMAENQLVFRPNWSPETTRILRELDPALGWVLVLIAAIWLYVVVTPGRRMTS